MLKHENIALVYGAAETDTHMLLVMEYVCHGSCVDFMKKCIEYGPRINIPMVLLLAFCQEFVQGTGLKILMF
jgi:serine/threonine protein kinase